MISVEEAKAIIFRQQLQTGIESIDFNFSLGRTLAEDILADRNMPPFDRVTMDGIAINYSDYLNEIRKWIVANVQYAGEAASCLTDAGQCIEVMTGAVLPNGCDTIIRYEDLQEDLNSSKEKHFELIEIAIKKGQNIHFAGSDKKVNDIVLNIGQIIASSDIALLATVGKQKVEVYKKLNIAVIATGDELTKIDVHPEEFQIRASNQHLITAALKEIGAESDQYLMRDDLNNLKDWLDKCLKQYDIVVITGAVSKGKADFIPSVLHELKVIELFHGVAQRPAKPFWFGRKQHCLVFAMPGNPVSATVCTYVYLLPFIQMHQGKKYFKFKAKVTVDITFKPSLNYFMQAKISQNKDGNFIANPFIGNGSGDLTNLAEINAFVELPSSEDRFNLNEFYNVYFTRNIICEQL